MNNKKGFILSTYVYMLLVFFLLLLTTMLAVMNNTKLLSNKLKEQSENTSGLTDKDYSFILLGEGDMIIRKGEEYIEPGFKIQTVKGVDLSDIVSITGNVDINLPNTYKLTYSATYNGITKRLTRNVTVLDNTASNYITGLYNYRRDENNLINPIVAYEENEYDTGIRYSGADPNNYVYFNCEDKDSSNIEYGKDNYNYKNSCETWRIIGVFDVENGEGNIESRVKLINTASTFKASWDSSAETINGGNGINQWGEVKDLNGNILYEGADLMRLLNGYYIGTKGATCKYCDNNNQESCNLECTESSLKNKKMKVLTNIATRMIENAVWDTYAVKWPDGNDTSSIFAPIAYLQEKGISTLYTGKICTLDDYCNDSIERTTSWTGIVGLMSVSDITYANGWLYDDNSLRPWSIISNAKSSVATYSWFSYTNTADDNKVFLSRGVYPSIYLKSSVQILAGDGTENNPYKLSI